MLTENFVKTRRLPDTDMARIAPLEPDARRRALMRMKGGHAPFSYEPTRKHQLGIIDARTPMFADSPEIGWDVIASKVGLASKSDEERIANLQVSGLLRGYVRGEGLQALEEEFGRFSLGGGQSLTYWLNAALYSRDQLMVMGLDFRRAGGLTEAGRRFAFSVMHEQIRARGGDFADARLSIMQFQQPTGGERGVQVYFADGMLLYSYEEIMRMASETYAVWHEVLGERAEEARRSGTDDAAWWSR